MSDDKIHPNRTDGQYKVVNKTRMFPAYVPDPAQQAPQHAVGLAPTVEMEEYVPSPSVLDVKMVVSMLIEKHLVAWKALPSNIRDMLLSHPEKFQLHSKITAGLEIPIITYNGVSFQYLEGARTWSLESIT